MDGECDSYGRGDNYLIMLAGTLVGNMLEVRRGPNWNRSWGNTEDINSFHLVQGSSGGLFMLLYAKFEFHQMLQKHLTPQITSMLHKI